MSETPPPSAQTAAVDSGKSAADENFPVGSVLIAPHLRPAIACFYRFARTADDIADSAALTPQEKIARLDAMAAALTDPKSSSESVSWIERARALAPMLLAHRVPLQHALDLLAAFKQDAVKSRYETWEELHAYCMLSAAPVGRFLLDLHGEDRLAWPASDALCNTLQVLNHLQDCVADFRTLDRVYLPRAWLAAGGADVDALTNPPAGPGVRAALDRCLDATDRWIALAETLPPQLRSRRLAMESTVIVHLAKRLSMRLRRGDPIARRVALSKPDFAKAALAALWFGLTRTRAHAAPLPRSVEP
jgi:squalene synthase HpnC